MDIFDNVITTLMVGVVIVPIVQAQFAIPAIIYAILITFQDIIRVVVVDYWKNHYERIEVVIRKYYKMSIFFDVLALLVVIKTSSAQYYLAMSLMTMVFNYIIGRYWAYVNSKLYWDYNVRLDFDIRKDKIVNICSVIAGIGAIVLIKCIPEEDILVVCAWMLLGLSAFDSIYSIFRINKIEVYLAKNPAPTMPKSNSL